VKIEMSKGNTHFNVATRARRRGRLVFIYAIFAALFAAYARYSPEARAAGPAAQLLVDRLAWTLLIAVGILYYTLPQAILLWTEPDMEQPQ